MGNVNETLKIQKLIFDKVEAQDKFMNSVGGKNFDEKLAAM